MKTHLVVTLDRYVHRVAWFIAEEGDIGAILGDRKVPTKLPPNEDPDWEHFAACHAVRDSEGCQRDGEGYYFDTRTAAETAKRSAVAAMKNKPLADWERKALSAGWKPPKGRM